MRLRLISLALCTALALIGLRFLNLFASTDFFDGWRSLGLFYQLGVLVALANLIPTAIALVELARTKTSASPADSAFLRRRPVRFATMQLALAVLILGCYITGWWGAFLGTDCAGSGCIQAWNEIRDNLAPYTLLVAVPLVGAFAWYILAAPKYDSAV